MLTLGQKLPGELPVAKPVQKTNIYRPGKAPEWSKKTDDDKRSRWDSLNRRDRRSGDDAEDEIDSRQSRSRRKEESSKSSSSTGRVIYQAEIVKVDSHKQKEKEKEKRVERRAPSVDLDNLTVPQPEEVIDEEQEERDRRARLRERYRLKKEQEERAEEASMQDEGEGDEEGEVSEYEEVTDSEDEEMDANGRPLFKPIFVPKKERETIEERERLEAADVELAELEKERLKERKEQTRQIVIEVIRREEAAEAEGDTSDDELPDDTDDLEDEAAITAWKNRELARLKRDREEREAADKDKEETERRRQLTDAEIVAENARLGLRKVKKKGQMRFLQKYYHKGAFFQDDEILSEELSKRDFNAATGMDQEVDKAMLPKVLQVKNFGLAGRTKYTHLVDQDTTQNDANPWAAAEREIGQYNPLKKPRR
eukprot:TRINITY_DN10962_c0_g2_i6.p1 TRINITY_DN10962_c0_g2~~TRINITY_DN10962_c0_g2_i6.p1  ORF type:complete len:426 (-),score=144.79 TRINITY_DN10962_c0_g2_i6:75-1352(-)